MNELITIRVGQARAQARAGNFEKSVELLEQARALARGDRPVQVAVLRELSEMCRLAGRADQAARVAEELEAIAPGSRGGITELSPMPERRGAPRWMVASLVSLAVLLVGAGGVLIWVFSDRQYNASPAAAGQPQAAAPAASPSPVTPPSPVPPPSAGGTPVVVSPVPVNSPPPAAPAPTPTGAGISIGRPPSTLQDYKARESLMETNVGMFIKVARYEGTVNNAKVTVDLPISTGTCFAVEHSGIMLSNKHVTSIAPEAIPSSLENAPTVTRRSTTDFVCFGADNKNHFKAEILYESSRYDLAILKIEKPFPRPFKLSRNSGGVAMGQPVRVAGYPGVIGDFLRVMNAQEVNGRIADGFAKGSLSYSAWFEPDEFKPTLTSGIVSNTSRRLSNASFIQIDAKVSHGNSGGPLLDEKDEVLGIITMGLGDSGHEAYNFALSTPQLLAELGPYLRKP